MTIAGGMVRGGGCWRWRGLGLDRGSVKEEREILLGAVEGFLGLRGGLGSLVRLGHGLQQGDGFLGLSGLGVLPRPA